jgi:RecB family exonuclease
VRINIIPEKDKVFERIELFKLPDFPVALKGKADLRIENNDTGEKHIYDYKSGKSTTTSKSSYEAQLNMYQRLYYAQEENVRKFIYFVSDQDKKEFSRSKKSAAELIEELHNILKELKNTGWFMGIKKNKYENDDLTRRSIMTIGRNE